jgi:hypothetical protein
MGLSPQICSEGFIRKCPFVQAGAAKAPSKINPGPGLASQVSEQRCMPGSASLDEMLDGPDGFCSNS